MDGLRGLLLASDAHNGRRACVSSGQLTRPERLKRGLREIQQGGLLDILKGICPRLSFMPIPVGADLIALTEPSPLCRAVASSLGRNCGRPRGARYDR